jgi:hypothetical protein
MYVYAYFYLNLVKYKLIYIFIYYLVNRGN